MRPILKSALTGGEGYQAFTKSMPAPILGWNSRDSLANMKPEDAPVLDNLFPQSTKIVLRNGMASHATGVGSAGVESLIPYASGATTAMLAAGGGALYEVKTAGAGVSKATGLTNDRWQHANFKGYLIMVNGADACRKYDGTTVTTNSVTGPAGGDDDLIGINVFKNQLFFIEENSMNAWYLAANAITGAASQLDFATLCSRGGYLMAMGTWTRDGGDGVDDLAVFVTSNGEVIIYQGTDPSDASKWALVGVFSIGAPIGRRCMKKVGGDLIIITMDGFTPLSKLLPFDRTAPALQLSDRISGAVNTATRAYSANFGWEGCLYAKGLMGIFNIPVVMSGSVLTTAHQYVINLATGAWCRFTGWNANCFAVLDDVLYFGGMDGKVYKADSGVADAGANIVGDVQSAFSNFGMQFLKQFLMVRPAIASSGTLGVAVTVNVDYQNLAASGTPTSVAGAGTQWDAGQWDSFDWASDEISALDWIGVVGLGYAAALRMRIATNALTFSWAATEFMFKRASMI